MRIGTERGHVQPADGQAVLVTTHPSAVVRLRGRDGFREAFDELVADLHTAVEAIA